MKPRVMCVFVDDTNKLNRILARTIDISELLQKIIIVNPHAQASSLRDVHICALIGHTLMANQNASSHLRQSERLSVRHA